MPFVSDPSYYKLTQIGKTYGFFYEYFHGETGQGLGTKHQIGWTGLIANLIMRRHDRHIAPFWESKSDHNKSKA